MEQKVVRVNVGLLVSTESIELVRKVDNLVLANRHEKVEFGRSALTRSSFYPKVHLLQCRDVDPLKLQDLKSEWSAKRGFFEAVKHMFHISELQHTNDGRLLLVLRPPVYIAEWKDRLVDLVDTYRTKEEKRGKGGDPHFYSPAHISIGADITPDEFERIQDKFLAGTFVGQILFFEDLVMYEKRAEWGVEEDLEYF